MGRNYLKEKRPAKKFLMLGPWAKENAPDKGVIQGRHQKNCVSERSGYENVEQKPCQDFMNEKTVKYLLVECFQPVCQIKKIFFHKKFIAKQYSPCPLTDLFPYPCLRAGMAILVYYSALFSPDSQAQAGLLPACQFVSGLGGGRGGRAGA
jgi:hypothetical protein